MVKQNLNPEIEYSTSRLQRVFKNLQKRRVFGINIAIASFVLTIALVIATVLFATGTFEKIWLFIGSEKPKVLEPKKHPPIKRVSGTVTKISGTKLTVSTPGGDKKLDSTEIRAVNYTPNIKGGFDPGAIKVGDKIEFVYDDIGVDYVIYQGR